MLFTRHRFRHLLLLVGTGVALVATSQLLWSWGSGDDYQYSTPTTIPKILHQTWDSPQVPGEFRKWMQSWRTLHPTWDFWFWTQPDVRRLLLTHYPEYIKLYDSYESSIYRADVMRYFVLFYYGGVYADLDVEALRPLDDLIDDPTNDCILSYENYEHTYFVYQSTTPVVMTTVMASRPRHPYLGALQRALPLFAKVKNVVYATGPFFLNEVFLQYKISTLGQSRPNTITALHPKYLLPTYDKGVNIKNSCATMGDPSGSLGESKKRLCDIHQATNWRNSPVDESYTNHHWYHVILKKTGWKETIDTFHIDELSPTRRNLETVLPLVKVEVQ